MITPMIDMHVRPTVLWREARWHCECSAGTALWTLRLFVDDTLASECVVDSAHALLPIAQKWREAVGGHGPGSDLAQILIPKADRRQQAPERRAIPRGGRRATEPGRQR